MDESVGTRQHGTDDVQRATAMSGEFRCASGVSVVQCMQKPRHAMGRLHIHRKHREWMVQLEV